MRALIGKMLCREMGSKVQIGTWLSSLLWIETLRWTRYTTCKEGLVKTHNNILHLGRSRQMMTGRQLPMGPPAFCRPNRLRPKVIWLCRESKANWRNNLEEGLAASHFMIRSLGQNTSWRKLWRGCAAQLPYYVLAVAAVVVTLLTIMMVQAWDALQAAFKKVICPMLRVLQVNIMLTPWTTFRDSSFRQGAT